MTTAAAFSRMVAPLAVIATVLHAGRRPGGGRAGRLLWPVADAKKVGEVYVTGWLSEPGLRVYTLERDVQHLMDRLSKIMRLWYWRRPKIRETMVCVSGIVYAHSKLSSRGK
jgi:hypothetical protein